MRNVEKEKLFQIVGKVQTKIQRWKELSKLKDMGNFVLMAESITELQDITELRS